MDEKEFPMETPTNTTRLPETMLTEILARLPLRSISRFKSVCKTWKSTLESVYFRRLFVSLHQNSSSSWSLLCGTKDLIWFHGCETWDLPKSLACYIPQSFKYSLSLQIKTGGFGYEASSNGLVLIQGPDYVSFVGNPVLQQWVEIPSPPPRVSSVLGLMTRVDEDGVVLGFIVVRLAALIPSTGDVFSMCMSVFMYFSETGIWTSKLLHCPHHITNLSTVSLDGTIYLSQTGINDPIEHGVLIAHDFYSESDQFRVIPLPDQRNHSSGDFKSALTTARGFVMYIKTLAHNLLNVWRLINDSGDDERWQLVWNIGLPFIRSDIGYYVPIAMHPFNSDIVYVWSQQSRHLVSCNLQTLNYRILIDTPKRCKDGHQDCFMNQSICDQCMDDIWESSQVYDDVVSVKLFQFVLPRWMESIPCPPQVTMTDTTSLLSYIASLQKRRIDA